MVRIVIYALIALALTACGTTDLSGFFVSPSDGVDERFAQSMDHVGDRPLSSVDLADEYTFYVCTDVHTDGTTVNMDRFVSDLRNDPVSGFGVVLGDVIDRRGMMDTFASALTFDASSHAYDRPVFVIPGNHDMFFSQWDDFKAHFGASVYFFEAVCGNRKDIFIALDSASGTLGSRQMVWLRTLLKEKRGNYRHCFVLTHTNIFKTDNSQTPSGNMPVEETLALTELFDRYDVTAVFQGHDHFREDVWYRGVRYTLVGALEDAAEHPEYLKVTASDNGLGYEWVLL